MKGMAACSALSRDRTGGIAGDGHESFSLIGLTPACYCASIAGLPHYSSIQTRPVLLFTRVSRGAGRDDEDDCAAAQFTGYQFERGVLDDQFGERHLRPFG